MKGDIVHLFSNIRSHFRKFDPICYVSFYQVLDEVNRKEQHIQAEFSFPIFIWSWFWNILYYVSLENFFLLLIFSLLYYQSDPRKSSASNWCSWSCRWCKHWKVQVAFFCFCYYFSLLVVLSLMISCATETVKSVAVICNISVSVFLAELHQ